MIAILNQMKDVLYNVDVQSEVVEQHHLFAIGYSKGGISRLLEILNSMEDADF
jgi:hypothetical protein